MSVVITNPGGGGGVSSVSASAPLASSGGATPNLSFTGNLAETLGGTGQSTYAQGEILYADAANSLGKLAHGSTGYVLISTSSSVAWDNPQEFFFSKLTVSFSDFTASALTETLQIMQLDPYEVVESAFLYVKTAFDAPLIVSALFTLGDDDNSDPTSIFPGTVGGTLDAVTAGQKRYQSAGKSADFDTAAISDFTGGVNQLTVTLTSNVNVDTLTAGELTVYIKRLRLSAP